MKEKKNKCIAAATVGEKGQIVIPKNIRDIFDIKPGDTLILFADKKKGIGIPPKDSFSDLSDMIMNKGETDDE